MTLTLVAPTSTRTDAELIAACVGGDERAQRELFRREYPRVNATIYRLLGSTRDVDDLAQETFIAVFRALSTFRGDSKLSTWIDRIAVRVVFHHIRARKPTVSLEMLPDAFVGCRMSTTRRTRAMGCVGCTPCSRRCHPTRAPRSRSTRSMDAASPRSQPITEHQRRGCEAADLARAPRSHSTSGGRSRSPGIHRDTQRGDAMKVDRIHIEAPATDARRDARGAGGICSSCPGFVPPTAPRRSRRACNGHDRASRSGCRPLRVSRLQRSPSCILVGRDQRTVEIAGPSLVETPVGGSSRFTVGDAVIQAGGDTSVSVSTSDAGVMLVLGRGAIDCDVEPRKWPCSVPRASGRRGRRGDRHALRGHPRRLRCTGRCHARQGPRSLGGQRALLDRRPVVDTFGDHGVGAPSPARSDRTTD